MIPSSDGIAARRFPLVNVALIAANFAVFLSHELPDPDSAVSQAAFYPCDVNSACHMGGLPWGLSWIAAMFMHASWDHILGNMLFLAIFGENVEDAFGRLGYLFLYFCGGFVAAMMQTGMTLLFGFASDAQIPALGTSGAIAAVLGAYFVLYPKSRVLTLVLWFPVRIAAWLFLGGWFLYNSSRGNSSLIHPAAAGSSGVAFFVHVGGFVFGVIAAKVLIAIGQAGPITTSQSSRDRRRYDRSDCAYPRSHRPARQVRL